MSARAAPPTGTCGCSTILFDFDEIRVHSRRPESRDGFAAKLSADLGKPVTATRRLASLRRGRRHRRGGVATAGAEPLLKTAWIKPGALVVPYGTMSAVELSLTDIMAKIVVDDWGQCKARQVRRAARACRDRAAERGDAACRARPDRRRPKPGRENDDETILFWHRGLSLSDIALGQAMLRKAQRRASASGCVSHDARSC